MITFGKSSNYKKKFGEGAKSIGRSMNEAVSLLVFIVLDIIDLILCFSFKALDFFFERKLPQQASCYCFSPKEAITKRIGGTGKVLVSEKAGDYSIVRLLMMSTSTSTSTFINSSSFNDKTKSRLQLEDLSDTLYNRPSLLSQLFCKTSTATMFLRRPHYSSSSSTTSSSFSSSSSSSSASSSHSNNNNKYNDKLKVKLGKEKGMYFRSSTTTTRTTTSTTFTVNSTVVEMLQPTNTNNNTKCSNTLSSSSLSYQPITPAVPRWSDCDCPTCTSWISSPNLKDSLFLRVEGAKGNAKGTEDVLFIHGFISSSKFWTETVFPNLSSSAKSKYRLFAVDLLGFGRSPKPTDSLYTLREHLDMIERSVLEAHKANSSLHIVAHSLGCILALALAVKHPGCIKSLTLLAPPYFGLPPNKREAATQYVMRRVAPRRVWPAIAFGASIACWYEHISRAVCLLFCKNHRIWEFLVNRASRNRIKCFLLEGFWCHTHNAAWHTLHNVICGTAKKLDGYLDTVRESLKCDVTVFHGTEDELIPVECSHMVQSKIPRARLKLIEHKDHITIVVGRQKAFARELEDIWRKASATVN